MYSENDTTVDQPSLNNFASQKIIAITNQQKNSCKTTTAVNLAACLSSEGMNVLIIDMDPDAHAGRELNVNIDVDQPTLFDFLMDEVDLNDVILTAEDNRLKYALANALLHKTETEFCMYSDIERVLLQSIEKVKKTIAFDYIIIDCPPKLNILTVNALAASQYCVIPIQSHCFSQERIKELSEVVNGVRLNFNTELMILGILITMFDSRNKPNEEFLKQIRSSYHDLVFETIIPVDVSGEMMNDSRHHRQVLKPLQDDSMEYLDLTREVVSRTRHKTLTSLFQTVSF